MNDTIVATSDQPSDDPLASYCESEDIKCFRGSLDDLAERIIAVADDQGADSFVRISGDSPVIDPNLIDRGICLFEDDVDLVTNVFPRTFPPGQSVEVVSTEALKRLHRELPRDADLMFHREHVTSGFYQDSQKWNIINFTSGIREPLARLVVDTREDYQRLEKILQRVDDGDAGWRALLRLAVEQ